MIMRKVKTHDYRANVKSVFTGMVMAALALMIHNGVRVFESLVTRNKPTQMNTVGSSDILKPGHYFLSVGRPRANCKLFIDGILKDHNGSSDSRIREKLTLASSFLITKDSITSFQVDCLESQGFASSLTHSAVIAPHLQGKALHLWRLFNELALGPFTAMLLLVFSVMYRPKGETRELGYITNYGFIIFASITLLYAVSLSHYPRLFLTDFSSSLLHANLRILFSLGFAMLCIPILSIALSIAGIHVIALSLLNYVTFMHHVHFEYAYDIIIYTLAGCTLILCSSSYFKTFIEPRDKFVRNIINAWGIVQLLDMITLNLGFGAYNAPSAIAVISLYVSYMIYINSKREVRQRYDLLAILGHIDSNLPIQDILKKIGKICLQATHFKRLSCYLDGVVLKRTEISGQYLYRIFELGYEKDTTKDRMLIASSGDGRYMIDEKCKNDIISLSTNEQSGDWFLNININNLAFINISSSRELEESNAIMALHAIMPYKQAINQLSEKLERLSHCGPKSLYHLKNKLGTGQFDRTMVVIRADVNGYKKLSEIDGFNNFFLEKYLQALKNFMANLMLPEVEEGDQVFLIGVSDIYEENIPHNEVFEQCIARFLDFTENEGSKICSEYGFAPLEFKICASIGEGSIICNKDTVSLTGNVVNTVARLLERATTGCVLVDKASVATNTFTKFTVKESSTGILVKNDYIEICHLWSRAERKLAA